MNSFMQASAARQAGAACSMHVHCMQVLLSACLQAHACVLADAGGVFDALLRLVSALHGRVCLKFAQVTVSGRAREGESERSSMLLLF